MPRVKFQVISGFIKRNNRQFVNYAKITDMEDRRGIILDKNVDLDS